MSQPIEVSDFLTECGADGLGDSPSADAREAVLRTVALKLNGADPLRRATARQGLKDRGFPARMIDSAFDSSDNRVRADDSRQGSVLALSDPDPWPEPVDGAAVLDELRETHRRYIAPPEAGDVAFALWVVHTHAHDAAFISPILALTSPEKRCGKTQTLALLLSLVPRPLPATNVTSAVVFRTVEAYRPTLLVDEADTFLGEHPELRGILNSGHRRDMAYVPRTVGEDHEPRMFSTWAPKSIAMIGRLPGTLADRSIELRMRRRTAAETVEPLRADHAGRLEPLRRRAWTWAQTNLEALRVADPVMPAGLHDRAADNWRPLIAIADLAGGEWPTLARWAAGVLSSLDADGTEGAGILLLADIRDIFDRRGVDRLATKHILHELHALEESPWPEWYRGSALSARALAKLLRPFEVHSKQTWIGSENLRGYERDQFEDAFRRYIPILRARTLEASNGAANGENSNARTIRPLADRESRKAAEVRHSSILADTQGVAGEDMQYEADERAGMQSDD